MFTLWPILLPPAPGVLTPLWSTDDDPTFGGTLVAASSAGDVDGDGFDDVVVIDTNVSGIPGPLEIGVYAGAAVGLSTSPAWTIAVDVPDAGIPTRVASAGDVNGDGFDDVIVSLEAGFVLVVPGSPNGPDSDAAWLGAAVDDGEFGSSVAGAGDVNGDGFDDLLVGAPTTNRDIATIRSGSAYLYLGSASGPGPSPVWIVEGVASDDLFGTVVASAGDVNGDGFDEVAVGASCDDTDGAFGPSGRIDVFLGSASGPSLTADWTARAEDRIDGIDFCIGFGNVVASAGDVNGDGFDDLVAGAPAQVPATGPAEQLGEVAVYLGSSTGLHAEPDRLLLGTNGGGLFGGAVASAGDVDGDGYDDVVVGMPHDDAPLQDQGTAFVYRGGPAGLAPQPAWSESSDGPFAYFGVLVDGLGDVNADGLDDVLVGAGSTYGWDQEPGSAHVYAGSAACLDPPTDADEDGTADGCDLCVGSDASGDLDGDGLCALGAEGGILDCDDGNPDVHPGAEEVCDGADTDCVGGLAEDEQDADGDGVYPCGGDCNDDRNQVNPYVDEVCANHLDDDCDRATDEDCPVVAESGGCGCATTDRATALWVLTAAAVAIRRRRGLMPTRTGHA
jgi:hypothetical protein